MLVHYTPRKEQQNYETPFPVKFKIGDSGHIFNLWVVIAQPRILDFAQCLRVKGNGHSVT